MNNIIEREWTRKGLVFTEDLRGTAFTYENKGHTFIISGRDTDGSDLALSGTVAGSFIRSDGTTTALNGSIADGKAQIVLSEECYGVSGRGTLTIFLTSSGQKTAIYSCIVSILISSTGKVSPGVAADVADLINKIDSATASIPADYSTLLASIAPDYSNTKTYNKNDPVWYGGSLYVAKQDIPTAESWNASHWKKVVLASEWQTNLSAETTARTNADTALSTSIDTEISERQTQDTLIREDLTAEITERETADNDFLSALNGIGLNVVDGVLVIDPVTE